MFNNDFEFKVKNVQKDPEGNYLMVTINVSGKDILLVSLYGPNRDEPLFYCKLKNLIKASPYDELIIGGDWNLVPNFTLDYCNYKTNNNVKAQEQLETMMTEIDLVDIWRELNPELRRFTWRRSRPLQQSRLDFFYRVRKFFGWLY
jgi:exonuclease III